MRTTARYRGYMQPPAPQPAQESTAWAIVGGVVVAATVGVVALSPVIF
jgi:hypothetical protein